MRYLLISILLLTMLPALALSEEISSDRISKSTLDRFTLAINTENSVDMLDLLSGRLEPFKSYSNLLPVSSRSGGWSSPVVEIVKSGKIKLVAKTLESLHQQYGPLEKAFGEYGYNLLFDAIGTRDLKLIRVVLSIEPELVNLRNGSWSGDKTSVSPFAYAVLLDNVDICKLLVEFGTDIEDGSGYLGWFPDANLPSFTTGNTLAIARTEKMIAYLRSIHVSETFPMDEFATVNDDKVRLRKSPSTTAEILGMVNKGASAQVLGATSRPSIIGTVSVRWYQVEVDNVKGWIFGQFLTIQWR